MSKDWSNVWLRPWWAWGPRGARGPGPSLGPRGSLPGIFLFPWPHGLPWWTDGAALTKRDVGAGAGGGLALHPSAGVRGVSGIVVYFDSRGITAPVINRGILIIIAIIVVIIVRVVLVVIFVLSLGSGPWPGPGPWVSQCCGE